MGELKMKETAYLFKELLSEICGFHHLCPISGLKMMATTYLFNELISEICGFHRPELTHRPELLLYVTLLIIGI